MINQIKPTYSQTSNGEFKEREKVEFTKPFSVNNLDEKPLIAKKAADTKPAVEPVDPPKSLPT